MNITATPPTLRWPALIQGSFVTLVDQRGNRIRGHVDAMTEDRSVLWLQLEGGLGRRLIHHQDGFELLS